MKTYRWNTFSWFLKTDSEDIYEFMKDEKRSVWIETYQALLAMAED